MHLTNVYVDTTKCGHDKFTWRKWTQAKGTVRQKWPCGARLQHDVYRSYPKGCGTNPVRVLELPIGDVRRIMSYLVPYSEDVCNVSACVKETRECD
jgi:hypothetical protein